MKYTFKMWFIILLMCLFGSCIFPLLLYIVYEHSRIGVCFLMVDIILFISTALWASTIKD
jgi:hypothetical protein